ncbi:Crp/Fnr family transcriptional regulator [Fulvivirga sp. M361]|uniref:Crp/Fnr family transcriptional regulator n=1 Tax=Fulvivirga sp. M361 TaxID=2594266 RepID=UPI00117A9FFD|nr:Crp/Fnr family transcriptional regulator [Fulvivirga sp. M361]TRX56075.1 Crp/Fnr family transcriptional regulator [Fulvivirga sp. M361]
MFEDRIRQALHYLSSDLVEQILQSSKVMSFATDTEILREGQYVKVVPLVLDGLIKVFTSYEDKELLLYYIQPDESCIMSFSAGLKDEPSRVFAVVEQPTEALLMPVELVSGWTKSFPDINTLFFKQYGMRYADLLDTVNHLLYDKLDKRLFEYLQKKSALTGANPIKMTHRQIANELGTSREVISRVMKKLEAEGHVRQEGNSVKIVRQ